MSLRWRKLCGAKSAAYLDEGAELRAAFAGEHNRFALIETRAYLGGTAPQAVLVVRDAARVTDAQLRAGERAPIVGRFACLSDALAFVEGETKAAAAASIKARKKIETAVTFS